MVEKTPRLNLDDYEPGDNDWDHSDTVNAVDEHAIVRGPIADRPATGEYDDELYHATDQNITWRWDADAADWVAAGGTGSESQPIPGTTHLEGLSTDETVTDSVASDNAIHPDFTQDFGRTAPLGRTEYDISVVNGSWSFDEFLIDASAQVDAQLEGVAYKDGHVYFGEEVSDGSPATIRKYTVDGQDTGETFTFGSGQANHTNSMYWYDGYLWVNDASAATDTDYIVDFDAGTVVGTIDRTGDIEGEAARGFIPATDGKMYLLYTNFGSTGYGSAHLVDLDGARNDGETAGNIYKTLSQDGLTSRPQAGIWRNGYYYFTDHRIAAKLKMPFADQLRDGYPVMAGENVEWVHARPFDYELEDFAYNPDRDEWYVGQAASSAGVHRVTEGWGDNVQGNWDTWSIGSDSPDRPRHLNVATAGVGNQVVKGVSFASKAIVEVWVWDNTNTSEEAHYVAVADDNGVGEHHTLSIKTDETNGGSNYYRWNTTDSWEDTGVARPSNPQWVRFAFHATGNEMQLYISTDHGRTWQDAGTKTTNSTTISELILRNPDGSFKVGTWNIQLLETPTV